MHLQTGNKQRRVRGFSLIEVTIALAVIATALIPLIALLPGGMSIMRKGDQAATEAEIVRLISSELNMSDWEKTNKLLDWEGVVRFYDKDGVRVEDGQYVAFTVKTSVEKPTTIPGDTNPNPFLRAVTIKITNFPLTINDRFSDPKKFKSYTNLIARMDK